MDPETEIGTAKILARPPAATKTGLVLRSSFGALVDEGVSWFWIRAEVG